MSAVARSAVNSSTKPGGTAAGCASPTAGWPPPGPALGAGGETRPSRWPTVRLSVACLSLVYRNPERPACGLVLYRDLHAAQHLAQLAGVVGALRCHCPRGSRNQTCTVPRHNTARFGERTSMHIINDHN